MLRHKMKSTTQIVFSWSLYVYLSEGWKCLFLRYKTDMHKSISESSKEETDRAQKVYVGWLLFFGRLWSSGSFMGYFHLPYLLFPWRRRRVSDPVTNTFWITNSVPQGLPQLVLLSGGGRSAWGEDPGAGGVVRGEMAMQPLRAVPRPALHPCSCQGWSALNVGQQSIWHYALKPEAIPSLNVTLFWEVGVWCCSVFYGHPCEEDGIWPSIIVVQTNQL